MHRTRLFDLLDRGQHQQLTVVVGSPGGGKSVLLADWLEARPQRRAVWVACDSADSDPVRFCSAIIEACRRTCGPGVIGEDAQQLLNLEGKVSVDVAAALADDLETRFGPLVLVIDDLHLARTGGIEVVAALLQCRPPTLQLVLATRVEPDLRLHRMRANEQLVELRDRELAFSREESLEMLSGMGVGLGEGDLAVIHERTEGWAAGLQMAALSLRQTSNRVGGAGRATVRSHTVAGYFLDEVLNRQPAEIAEFMLATSILDELSPSVCRALCGSSATKLLEAVYRANLFLILIDDDTPTYRYHHLIREVLRAELHVRDRSAEIRLHETAAEFLADAGQIGSAARLLLAIGEPSAAFTMLNRRVVRDFAVNTRLGSALDLPDVQPDMYAGAPELLVPLATELILRGAFERGSHALALAERAGVDVQKQPALFVQLEFIRAFHGFLIGQLDEALAYRDNVLQLDLRTPDLDEWLIGLELVAIGAHSYLGRGTIARQLLDELDVQPYYQLTVETSTMGEFALAALRAGELKRAETLATASLDAVRRYGFDRHYFIVPALRTNALLALERHDLATAEDVTERVLALLGGGRPVFEYLAQVDRARIWAAAGHVDAALASLPLARSALRNDRSPLLAYADEVEARLRLALGDTRGATETAARLPAHRRKVLDARVALAADRPEESVAILSDPLDQEINTTRLDLERKLLVASTALVQGSPIAERLIREALQAAENQGFIQTVLEMAPQLVAHVITRSDRYPPREYLRQLIAAGLDARKHGSVRSSADRLPDQLTQAEQRVLQLLPQPLTYAEIATDLGLSLNTVKTHVKRIYLKLGVTARSGAVRRATALGLL